METATDKKIRIGLYGGSFNPPHLGHLQIAEEVKRLLRLDRMVLIPAGNPYMKDKEDMASSQTRFSMLLFFVNDASTELCVDTLEIDRNGPSYTVDTLREYRKKCPNAELYTIVGADAFESMKYWKDPEEIARLSTIVVVRRAGSEQVPGDDATYTWWSYYTDRIMFLDILIISISSTDIRYRIGKGFAWHHLVSPGIADYIDNIENPYEVKNV